MPVTYVQTYTYTYRLITRALVQPRIQSLFSLTYSDRNPISQLAPLTCFFFQQSIKSLFESERAVTLCSQGEMEGELG